jgi:hypothetical protein
MFKEKINQANTDKNPLFKASGSENMKGTKWRNDGNVAKLQQSLRHAPKD